MTFNQHSGFTNRWLVMMVLASRNLARGIPCFNPYQVLFVCFLKLHVLDAIFTDPQFILLSIFLREG